MSSIGQLQASRLTWVFGFVSFRKKVNSQSSRSGNDEMGSSSQQFWFDNKVVNSALDNFLVSGGEIFIDLSIKRGVAKLPHSLFLVEIAPPNYQSTSFVSHLDNYVFTTVY